MAEVPRDNDSLEGTPTSTRGNSNGTRKRATVILFLLVIGSCLLALNWWVKGKTHVSTDNAFVEADIHAISSRIPGIVQNILVRDNQLVKKGAMLVELDQAEYRVRKENAAAAVDIARNETSGEYAKVESARATLHLAKARLDQAELDLKRGTVLFQKEVIPREQLDRLETARKVTALQVREGEENLRRALAEVGQAGSGGKDAKVTQKRAQLDEAALNLSYTKVLAPADGYITRKSAEIGNYIQPGQPLMALVRLDNSWIVANYKERQLTHVRPGQKVEFEVDAYPGRKFTGRVDSIMAGTGAAFSLLPPENATGNYVKVVQRIPVKIVIDRQSDPDHLLRVGMSVVPAIQTERRLIDILKELNPFT